MDSIDGGKTVTVSNNFYDCWKKQENKGKHLISNAEKVIHSFIKSVSMNWLIHECHYVFTV